MKNLGSCCICLLIVLSLVLSLAGSDTSAGTATSATAASATAAASERSGAHNDRTVLPERDDSGQTHDVTAATAFSCNLLAEQMNKCCGHFR